MRIQTDSIVTALVILSLVSGAVGCRSNGGPWYNPKSYTWHNPFKSKEEASLYGAEGTAHAANPKPSTLTQPNVSTPPGGYTSKEDEARFFAGKKESGTMMVPQYQAGSGVGTDANRVASNGTAPANGTPITAYASDRSYNPYGTPENNGLTVAASPTPSGYQPTNYHYEQQTVQPGTYLPASPYANPSATPAAPTSAAPAVANNYSPYGVPVQDNTPIYGNPQTQPVYQPQPVQQPAAPVGNPYGVPTATPYNVDPAAGFTANPSSYQPTNPPSYQPTNPPTGF